MSGGIDSTVAAILLQEQAYALTGFFLELPVAGLEEQRRQVCSLARRLSIPLVRVDLQDVFTDQVLIPFREAYLQGQTPNPCVRCNREIKFGRLFQIMREHGMAYMATGHYVRTGQASSGEWSLLRGVDPGKDQSYFLCRLPASLLSRLLFPLGPLTKKAVYSLARERGLAHTRADESQDVCFLDQGMDRFFTHQGVAARPGPIVDARGQLLGEHRGIWHYTIGQRRGLGIPDATPWYVIGLDVTKNQVIVGKQQELLQYRVRVTEVFWHHPPPGRTWEGLVQLRSRHQAARARICRLENQDWLIIFREPQRAVTPGQYAVFYDDERLVGSGLIRKTRGELCNESV